MTARILDGKALSEKIIADLTERIVGWPRPPGLAVVLVGADPASQLYVRKKGQAAEKLGFRHQQIDLPAETPEEAVLAVIDRLNADPAVDGILVQLPLPKAVSTDRVMDRIDPDKDVDGFTIASSGRLSQGRPGFVPCTPAGIMRLLAESGVALAGAEAVVIGRSNIVGRPIAQLLEHQNATVTLCHSRSRDLEAAVRRADVVVAAVGKPNVVLGRWLKPGAVVIDVGMNRDANQKLCGDVEYAAAAEVAGAITPVPGGVGPMTIAMLMHNTYHSAANRLGLKTES